MCNHVGDVCFSGSATVATKFHVGLGGRGGHSSSTVDSPTETLFSDKTSTDRVGKGATITASVGFRFFRSATISSAIAAYVVSSDKTLVGGELGNGFVPFTTMAATLYVSLLEICSRYNASVPRRIRNMQRISTEILHAGSAAVLVESAIELADATSSSSGGSHPSNRSNSSVTSPVTHAPIRGRSFDVSEFILGRRHPHAPVQNIAHVVARQGSLLNSVVGWSVGRRVGTCDGGVVGRSEGSAVGCNQRVDVVAVLVVVDEVTVRVLVVDVVLERVVTLWMVVVVVDVDEPRVRVQVVVVVGSHVPGKMGLLEKKIR